MLAIPRCDSPQDMANTLLILANGGAVFRLAAKHNLPRIPRDMPDLPDGRNGPMDGRSRVPRDGL
jgi:hypothetical protein